MLHRTTHLGIIHIAAKPDMSWGRRIRSNRQSLGCDLRDSPIIPSADKELDAIRRLTPNQPVAVVFNLMDPFPALGRLLGLLAGILPRLALAGSFTYATPRPDFGAFSVQELPSKNLGT
jgi:hypothetical protein